MAQFRSNIPDIGVNVNITNFKLLNAVTTYGVGGHSLVANLKDGLSEDSYERVSKEIRILYSFCFEHVYSEDYDILTTEINYGTSGHNERKEHLLAENSHVSEKFGNMGMQLLEDISGLNIGQAKLRSFFNSAFIWSRANELQELKLLTEAYTQYWRLLDLIHEKVQMSMPDSVALLKEYGMPSTRSNLFAIRILHKMGMLRPNNDTGNIESLAYLDSLRHPHAHQASDRTDYYVEEETHLEAEINNIFISDITKLFIIWELGLRDYYLKPRANIYEIDKK
ncbi:MAG TPA: hypothetical protein VK497_03845 [Candidatus Saccharimonadales bacterium]|nr:hypothetical protein [Candidatus Saccharimonadales bacterium]